ncbi:RNA 2',3'-cyclic phosphodiesterase [Fulvivirga sediminis]|uniref:RNA 2',3'-cyclic phosphodiesterase n=1 Tax=Fulvivirga sediminis TaxID=2803949 RepID=A0A937F4L2_9BACT|nr:RNA 2',3'-cyclic phosphodiesterase [Fulvivirga sediminis]MBL3654787.1 RNA 2',3'-cyclic phosphodiesterase [Fulvivirga sediminis]
MKDLDLYFIAIIPPNPIKEVAQQWKEYFSEKYNSKAALKSPPHITLHMPFKWKEEKENRIFEALEKTASSSYTFDLVMNGFGAFEPRVIYMALNKPEGLSLLYKHLATVMKKELNIFNSDYKNRGYHPHLTVAFRDLKKAKFAEAWSEFQEKEYEANFKVHHFHLLKHNGKNWENYKAFELIQ